MKKSFVIILFAFFTFTLWAKPVYIEVEPDVFKWLELTCATYYDKHGNTIKVDNEYYNLDFFYEYNEVGHVISQYNSDAPEEVYKYEYKDDLITKALNPDGTYSLYSYDDNNNLISLEYVDPNDEDECETEYYEYDKFNNNIHVYESNDDFEIWYEYDKSHNLTKSFTSRDTIPNTYTYDEFDRIIKIVDKYGTMLHQYDDTNNIETIISIDNQSNRKTTSETHYNNNHDKIYEKITSEYGETESWYINEYYEDGKILKKVSKYDASF